MWILLTHQVTLHLPVKKGVFLKRLNDHAESSRSLNYFTATIQDYGITIKLKQERIIVRDKFGKRNFCLTLTVSDTDDGCIIQATVSPALGNIAMKGLLVLFVLVCPFPLTLKVACVALSYILELISLAFSVWWTSDLFQKKLLANSNPVKGRNL